MASSTSLAGKTALITGGSKGIGAATSLHLASLGANVVINYSSDSSAADSLLQTITTTYPDTKPLAIKASASSLSEIQTMVAQIVSTYCKLDIVIANAAIMPLHKLEDVTEDLYTRVMDTNIRGPLFLAQACAPHMPRNSSLIFVSTTLCTASTVTPPYLLYCMSKGAIEQMVRLLSKDLAAKGINVNAVAPGPTGTELFYKGKSEAVLNTIKGFSPKGEIGRPEDIADVMAFLAGEHSRWVTGQVLRVNGGMA